jgi:hypothetical protein
MKIKLEKALDIMDRLDHNADPIPFTIEFVSIHTGKWVKLENVVMLRNVRVIPRSIKQDFIPQVRSGITNRKLRSVIRRFYNPMTHKISSGHFRLFKKINKYDIDW